MLKRIICASLLVLCCVGSAFAADTQKNPKVAIETNLGTIKLELFVQEAPVSTQNFLEYVKSGFYNGTIFHRVIPGFMIQGGGFTKELVQKPTRQPIKNEAGNGLKNERGTIAMARTSIPDSATSQFFINVVNNAPLNHRDNSMPGYGYAVFGKVISGMDVVDRIAATPTGYERGFADVPTTPVIIKDVKVISK